jgi:hypothetical protein
MKASIRHVINPPFEAHKGLRERILNSTSIIDTYHQDHDDHFDYPSSSNGIAALSSSSITTNFAAGSSTSNTSLTTSSTLLSPLASTRSHSTTASSGIFNKGNGHTITNGNSISSGKIDPEIQIMEMHPSQTILCYVDKNGKGFNFNSLSIATTMKQRVVLHNYITNHTIGIISIIDIVNQYVNSSNSKSSKNNDGGEKKQEKIQRICQTFGLIQNIQFMDLHILQNESGCKPKTNTYISSLSSASSTKSPPSLIIHFKNRILVYPIGHYQSSYQSPSPTKTPLSPPPLKQKLVEITSQTLNKTNITCKRIIPILTTTLFAIGCSDGAMRFYSTCDGKIVKSVRGPNGKNDPIVGIISMNTWNWTSFQIDENEEDDDVVLESNKEERQSGISSSASTTSSISSGGNNTNKNISPSTKAAITKIMTICASGTAYLWELQVTFVETTGCIKKFHIRPPLVKIDVSSALLQATGSSSYSTSSSSLMSPTSMMTQNNFAIREHSCESVKFDVNRQMLFWTVRPRSNNVLSKSHVITWDFSRDKVTLTQQSSKLGPKNDTTTQHTPLHYPQSIIQLPLGDYVSLDTMMISGLTHSSFSAEAYTCLAVSRDGNLNVIGSSCQHALKTLVKKVNEDAVIYQYFDFLTMKRVADEKILGDIKLLKDGKLRVMKISSSHARPDVIVMATNVGLIVITLNDDDVLITGALHSCFSSARANSSGFIGAGNKILLVKDSSVYRASLSYYSSSEHPNPVGYIRYQEMLLFYRSPPPLNKSLDFQARPIRMPPRLLPSPSGNFLCLFWHTENRYEIIHNSSITNAARKSTRDQGPEYSPAVDTGSNVLSFAWIGDGDEDIFALLYPPELTKSDTGIVSKKQKNKIGKDDGEDDKNAIIDPLKFKPSVELKILVGVHKDAVAFSSSAAAATATSLGTLTLRGRHPPTRLFGGPYLCVSTLSQDKQSAQMDGMAYFYSRRMNSENDFRASSFVSVGPALPYPDLVVWDEDGKICTIIVGRRIAIYASNQPNFVLLGTACLGANGEIDAKVQSAKFLHGVLYCTTQTSVQCVFLGDTENEDVICELDTYVLSSSSGKIMSKKKSLYPEPQVIPLIRPSILGYFQGSLLVSSVNGIHAISLSYPLIRIGALLASGHYTRAQKWLHSIQLSQHDTLANFLHRRGFPDLAIQLPGLSLETALDFCLEYGYAVDRVQSY